MFNELSKQKLNNFFKNLAKNTKKDPDNWIFYEGKYFFAKNKKDVEDFKKLVNWK